MGDWKEPADFQSRVFAIVAKSRDDYGSGPSIQQIIRTFLTKLAGTSLAQGPVSLKMLVLVIALDSLSSRESASTTWSHLIRQ
jgi:hypothetical protein